MKTMAISFRRPHAGTATLGAPDPAAGHCWPTLPLETSGHSQASLGSLLWGHCSFLLSPGAHKVLFVPSKSLFPQSCVSSGGSVVGLMATSSKRAYVTARWAAPRAPACVVGHCWPVPLQEMLKHSNAGLAQSLWGLLVCTSFCLSLWASLAGMGFDPKCNFSPPIIFLGLLLCPWTWAIFFLWDSTCSCWWFVQQWAVILEFLQEKISTHPSTSPSCRICKG